jgi:sulfonate transport system permease protein
MKKEIIYGPISILIFWYLIFLSKVINPLFLPSPHEVGFKFIEMLTELTTWKDILSTTLRIIIGFIISVFVGVPIGLFMGYNKKIYDSFELVIDFFRSLPALALFPLFMFFVGIGDTAKILTSSFSCSLIIIINSIYGVKNVNQTRQIFAKLVGASKYEIFYKVIFKDALPQIFVGIRTSISIAVIAIIATEMFIGTDLGIGHRIYEAQLTYRVTEMYSSIIFAGLLGYILNQGFIHIEKKIVHWSGK